MDTLVYLDQLVVIFKIVLVLRLARCLQMFWAIEHYFIRKIAGCRLVR